MVAQLSITLVPGDPTHSSGLHGHQEPTWHTDKHAGKTHIYVKYIFKITTWVLQTRNWKACVLRNRKPNRASITAKVMEAIGSLLIEMITIRLLVFQNMVCVYSRIRMHGFFGIHRNQDILLMGISDTLSSLLDNSNGKRLLGT